MKAIASHALAVMTTIAIIEAILLHQFYAGKLTVQVAANGILGIF